MCRMCRLVRQQRQQLRSEDKQANDNGADGNGKNRGSSRIFGAASSIAILAVGRDIDEMLERSVDEFAGDHQRHDDGERDPAKNIDSEEQTGDGSKNSRTYVNAEVSLLGERYSDTVESMVKGFDYTAGFGGLALPTQRDNTLFGDNVKVGLECN